MAGKMTVAEAFNQFIHKFERSPQAIDKSKPRIIHENDIIQKKIQIREQDYNASIVAEYSKYLNPYKTLGKNSPIAASIDCDEQNLLRAYNLFKAVREANSSIGDINTFIKLTDIHSPLTSKDCYTTGGQFIYLQCWLIFAQNIKDFVPELVSQEENMQTVFTLQFSPFKTFAFSYQDKEVMGAVQEAFYPAN